MKEVLIETSTFGSLFDTNTDVIDPLELKKYTLIRFIISEDTIHQLRIPYDVNISNLRKLKLHIEKARMLWENLVQTYGEKIII